VKWTVQSADLFSVQSSLHNESFPVYIISFDNLRSHTKSRYSLRWYFIFIFQL